MSPAANPNKVVIAQTAPAVRVSIGEEVGMEPGSIATGQLVAALKELGFDYVYGRCTSVCSAEYVVSAVRLASGASS